MLTLLLHALAYADTASYSCNGELSTATWPPPGTEEVPIDTIPAVIFGADPCEAAVLATAKLSPEGGEAIAEATGNAQRGFFELAPAAALLPNTPYVIDLAASSQDQVASFTTGTEVSIPTVASVTVTRLEVFHKVFTADDGRGVSLHIVDLDLSANSGSVDTFVVRFAEGQAGREECCIGGAFVQSSGSAGASWASEFSWPEGSEWCIAPVVRNADGTRQEPAEETCTTVELHDEMSQDTDAGGGAGSCATGPAPLGLAAPACLWIMGRRRRK